MGSIIKKVFSDLVILALASLLGYFISKVIIFRVTVDGCSMEPTYYDGDVQLALTTGWVDLFDDGIQYGDIVIIEQDGGSSYLIKRVIGLPGDTVQIIDSKVILNGHEYHEEYIPEGKYHSGIAEDEVVLGVNDYFVLGDNRPVSHDSRSFGSVSKNQIKGVVLK